jgi:hypothetical protein
MECRLNGLRQDTSALSAHLRALNLLLIGTSESTRAALADLESSLVPPVLCWDAAPGDLPGDAVGSLIIGDVTRLTPGHQRQLLDWLNDRRRRVRVIACATSPLFPRVKSGLFSDGLYYRLNTVTILLDGQPDGRRIWDAA